MGIVTAAPAPTTAAIALIQSVIFDMTRSTKLAFCLSWIDKLSENCHWYHREHGQ